jgi:hypothetical protein
MFVTSDSAVFLRARYAAPSAASVVVAVVEPVELMLVAMA